MHATSDEDDDVVGEECDAGYVDVGEERGGGDKDEDEDEDAQRRRQAASQQLCAWAAKSDHSSGASHQILYRILWTTQCGG